MRTPSDAPLVSVVLATRGRPNLVRVAIACFAAQTLADAELILVVDEDEPVTHPLPNGTRTVVTPPWTPLGTKLNAGAACARGRLLAKWDDDDYYAPGYLAEMCAHLTDVASARVTFLRPFVLYDALTGRLVLSDPARCSGATLLMTLGTWHSTPFRDRRCEVDADFLLDVKALHGCASIRPRCSKVVPFVQLRHAGHLWNCMPDGRTVREWADGLPDLDMKLEDVVGRRVAAVWRTYAKSIAG